MQAGSILENQLPFTQLPLSQPAARSKEAEPEARIPSRCFLVGGPRRRLRGAEQAWSLGGQQGIPWRPAGTLECKLHHAACLTGRPGLLVTLTVWLWDPASQGSLGKGPLGAEGHSWGEGQLRAISCPPSQQVADGWPTLNGDPGLGVSPSISC